MKTNKYLYFVLSSFVLFLMSSCTPGAPGKEDLIIQENNLQQILAAENPNGQYTVYSFYDFLDTYMSEDGNFKSDSSLYRTRSTYGGLQLFSIDTLPTNGPGIYIRGRVVTDDYGGNFYKSLVLQQTVDYNTGEVIAPQGLRISVDMGSVGGMYQQGQEIIIRCNGLAIGRYANEPQLCVPSYNNNIFAGSASEKVGWAAGRIPSADFRIATHMIGEPDKSKLVYETMTMEELDNRYLSLYEDVAGVRKLDATLVKIVDVHFTGEYDDYGKPTMCNRYSGTDDVGNPEKDKNAYTFGPTTGNVGYPQSRFVADANKSFRVLVSTSEYARYAHFYLPDPQYVGSVTGVLGYYMDNGKYDPDGGEWAITPNELSNILPEAQAEGAEPRWIPTEWKLGTPQPAE
jgi:hypothetical protein